MAFCYWTFELSSLTPVEGGQSQPSWRLPRRITASRQVGIPSLTEMHVKENADTRCNWFATCCEWYKKNSAEVLPKGWWRFKLLSDGSYILTDCQSLSTCLLMTRKCLWHPMTSDDLTEVNHQDCTWIMMWDPLNPDPEKKIRLIHCITIQWIKYILPGLTFHLDGRPSFELITAHGPKLSHMGFNVNARKLFCVYDAMPRFRIS